MASLPYRVKAVYDYTSPHEDDLSFPNGQIITVTDEEDADWYYGEYVGVDGNKAQGLFPRNFVERYEPTTPPRPSRPTRVKKDLETKVQPGTQSAAADSAAITSPGSNITHEDDSLASRTIPEPSESAHEEQEAPPYPKLEPVKPIHPEAIPETRQPSEPEPTPTPVPAPPEQAMAPASSTSPAIASKPKPPVTEKPTSDSFRDRIAAFNKPTAPPVAPMKPGQSSTSGFVKKQYVAPPPSRNAYIPPPREPPPQKIYRREEFDDTNPPEVEFRDPEAVISPSEGIAREDTSEDQPKPTSLKDRIALLQKQQLEQATRHAEAAQKKEKPKRPSRKRSESQQRPTDPIEDDRHERGEEVGGGDDELGEDDDNDDDDDDDDDDGDGGDGYHGVPTRRSRPTEETPIVSPSSVPRELVSDTNDADQSAGGETEDGSELTTSQHVDLKPHPRESIPQTQLPSIEQGGALEGQRSNEDEQKEAEDEEEQVDPEVKKRMEIRERMAKMSGGMGMAGMFGPSGGLPMTSKKSKQTSGTSKTQVSGDSVGDSNTQTQATQGVPMALPGMSMPGLQRVRTPEAEENPPELGGTQSPEQMREQVEDPSMNSQAKSRRSIDQTQPLQDRPVPPPPIIQRGAPPPVPSGRAIPPSPLESRPLPAPPSAPIRTPNSGSDSDDELSPRHNDHVGVQHKNVSLALRQPPPIPSIATSMGQPSRPHGPRSPKSRREDNVVPSASSPQSPGSPPGADHPRRKPNRAPPIPGTSSTMSSPPQARAPPPPPPPGYLPPSRQSTDIERSRRPSVYDQDSEEEITEYEGDYDTDIAPGATHKDALKAHDRNSSADEGLTGDEASMHHDGLPSLGPTSILPPIPASNAPRAAPPPPPPPSQPPKPSRQSGDMPRAAPPQPNAEKSVVEDDYDPFNYASPQSGIGSSRSWEAEPVETPKLEDPLTNMSPPPSDTKPGPSQPSSSYNTLPITTSSAPRQSLDVHRGNAGRRSTEAPRTSMEQGYIAEDVDLGRSSQWWMQRKMPPPIFHNRSDVTIEVEESTVIQQDKKELVMKQVYALFLDYSQTIVTARFDPKDPTNIDLSQSHEPPPARLRQDQLEDASSRFGSRLADMANGKLNAVIGNGTPFALLAELLGSLPDALPPVGVRAYGALVYTNLANASVQQHDEIRAGDVITFRNAKMQGHRGPMKNKYAMDVGKPDHVGVVVDWDGTKKKLRAWEQGRESKKVKVESFKLSDLRSGEVKVWRVVSREWVGWGGGHR